MNVKLGDDRVIVIGKARQICMYLKMKSKQHRYVADWLYKERG